MARDNHIGSYRLLKLVRAGSTCQIWEVINELDNRRCALKVLQSSFRTDREQVALLKHEYLVGRDLDHPRIIDIFDFDVVRGVPYLALEFFESSNLKQWIRQTEDNVPHLPRIVEQCAEGLAYLHGQGWVHRDVKPDNFLVSPEHNVKLIDFAIAQKVKKGFSRFWQGRTKVQGTRSYMSPEQIRGESLDARADIYSFGCVLFELYSGRPPFTGGNADQLLQKHLSAPVPSVLAHNDQATPELANLVSAMMAKSPEDRPESMGVFLNELNSIRMLRTRR